VTLAPSDPSIVWVGTGEPNNRQSSSWGNGVYKSTDAGHTWTNMGLRDTHHIGRIVIHPTNPNVVYVAAVGRLWGSNKERGLYKTTDGGATWKQVLFVSQDTGVIDVAMDPLSPETLYAAAYQRRRTVFASRAAARGWHPQDDRRRRDVEAAREGTAVGPCRRAGSARPGDAAPGATAPGGGDAGCDHERVTRSRWDCGRCRVARGQEPARQEIGVSGWPSTTAIRASSTRSSSTRTAASSAATTGAKRGGRRATPTRARCTTARSASTRTTTSACGCSARRCSTRKTGQDLPHRLVQRIHGDYHAMWIDRQLRPHDRRLGRRHPLEPRPRAHLDFVNTIPLGQFYEIGLDMRQPYYICGGLQDNNTWCGPSASTNPRGIDNADWFTIGGGDGFHAQIDPTDHTIVYAESQDGNVLRRDLRTGESRSIRPQPPEGATPYRFQWNSPIVSRPTTRRRSTTRATSCSARPTAVTRGRRSVRT